jgi:hypothetical protein
MSRMAALVLLATAAAATPSKELTAEQAMANYRAMLKGAADTPRDDCPDKRGDTIIVCAHPKVPPPRLPLPDERAEAGEVVRHPGEPGLGDQGPPTGPPSKQMDTVIKLFGLLKGAATGEDTSPN